MSTSGSVDSGGYQGRVLRFEWGTNKCRKKYKKHLV